MQEREMRGERDEGRGKERDGARERWREREMKR